MKITLESTEETGELRSDGGVPVRLWRGQTADMVPVEAYIALVSPLTHDPEVNRRFAAELHEQTVRIAPADVVADPDWPAVFVRLWRNLDPADRVAALRRMLPGEALDRLGHDWPARIAGWRE